MQGLKRTGRLLVFLLAMLILTALMPMTTSAKTHIDSVAVNMAGLHFSFTPKYTEGEIEAQVLGAISIAPDSKYTVDPYNTTLLKEVNGTIWGVGAGNSHMSPSYTYYYEISLAPQSGYAFSDATSATVNGIKPYSVEYNKYSNYLDIRVKAPGVGQGNYTLYKITYDGNGGSGYMVENWALDNTGMTLPPTQFKPLLLKKFKCWAIGSPTGPQANPGDACIFTGDTRVYAVWDTYKIEIIETTTTSSTTSTTTTSTSTSTTTEKSSTTSTTATPADTPTQTQTPTSSGTTAELTEPMTDVTVHDTKGSEDATLIPVSTVASGLTTSSSGRSGPMSDSLKSILLWGLLLLFVGGGIFVIVLVLIRKIRQSK